jgi:hypothetical protein
MERADVSRLKRFDFERACTFEVQLAALSTGRELGLLSICAASALCLILTVPRRRSLVFGCTRDAQGSPSPRYGPRSRESISRYISRQAVT